MSDTALTPPALTFAALSPLVKRWAVWFVGALLVVGLGLWGFGKVVGQERRNALLVQEAAPLVHLEQQLQQAFSESLGDLGVISHLPLFASVEPNQNAALRERLAPFMLMFAQNYQHYQQVRFIDTEGMEVVRIERAGKGLRQVPAALLQNKASRPYVLEGLTLQANQAYVSVLDLNVENGELERPLRPMLRYVAPVFNAKGQRLGLMALNYEAQGLLDRFEATVPPDKRPNTWLMNERGFYLAGGDPERRWGFMLDMPRASLADDHPALWGSLQDQASGVIETDEGLFVFRRIHPLQLAQNSALQVPSQDSPMHRLWVVSQVAPQSLYALTPWSSPLGKGVLGLLAMVLGAGLWFWLKSDALKRGAQTLQQTLLNASVDGIHVLDANGQLLAHNEAFAHMLGYTAPQLAGLSVYAWDEMAKQGQDRQRLPRLGDKPMVFETVHRRADGQYIEVEVVAAAMALDDQVVLHCASRDISERKALQAAMRQSEKRAAQLIEHAPDPIFVINERGIIELVNPAAERLFGHTIAEMLGQNIKMLMPQPVRDQHDGFLRAYAQGGQAKVIGHTRELVAVDRQGQPIPIQLRVSIDPQADGSQRFVGFIRDLKDRDRAEQALLLAKDAAERANHAKSRFLTFISHEMRTPLNAISGLVNLLAHDPLTPHQQANLDKLRTANETMVCIVTDVLDMAKIEAGEFELAREVVDLPHVVNEAHSLIQVLAHAKGLPLHLHMPPDLPRLVWADALRLRQVLLNVLNNAVKFTAQGEVSLAVSAQAGDGDTAQVGFEVRDTGIGMPPEVVDRLFHAFETADDSATRPYGGTGLGLVIVHEIVSRLGGHVAVQSTLDQGTTVSISLPLALAGDASTSPHDANSPELVSRCQSLHGLRLLAVDDSPMNLDVLTQLLRAEGAEVATCADGQAALDWLAAQDTLPDAVVLDIQMPVMDGLTCVRRLRQDLRWRHLPVMALTANALNSQRQEALEAGMDAFLTKPLVPDQVVHTLRELVQAHRGEALPLGPPKTPPTAADPTAAWPAIDGIDSAAAQARMHGDVLHFSRQLRRLLSEHLPLPTNPDAHPSADWQRLLHKLAGNAGLLGAMDVMGLAQHAERQMAQGTPSEQAVALQQLANELSRLQHAAAPALAALAHAPAPAPSTPLPWSAQTLQTLITHLSNNDFQAATAYENLRPALSQHLSTSDMAALDLAIDALDFEHAKRLLSDLTPP